jgi:DNA polymerase-3 subunit gamma/tau
VALALYRKYRPRTFAEVIGQEHVTEPLSQALRSGRLNHAYLFSGPRGCGKTSSARILARSLNCEQGPTPEPCGKCGSCRSLSGDGAGSIDVIEIDAASHGGVDDARELRERAFFAPANSRFKIYVIDEAHMVSSAGFNALLKLVEEPPEFVKFIFATTEPEKVLGTIKSRTHHYPFRLIPPAVLRPYLEQLCAAEGVRVEPAVFPLVVRAGGGSARDSLSVLDQLIAGAGPEGVTYRGAAALLGVTDSALIDEMCDALAAGDGAAAYQTVDRVAEAGHDARRFAADLLERLRDLIVLRQVPDAAAKGLIDGPADQVERMTAQAQRLGPATLSRCADIVHNGLVEMRGTTAPRLMLELICARMLLPGADDSTGGLLQRLERMERRLTLGAVDAPPATAGSAPAADRPTVRPEPAPAPQPAAPQAPASGTPTAVATSPTAVAGPPAPPETPAAASRRVVPPEAIMPDPATPEPPPPDTQYAGTPDVHALRNAWNDRILPSIKQRNKRAGAMLQEASVADLDGDVLVLRFRHTFHANASTGHAELISRVTAEVLGGSWQVRCEVAGGAPAPAGRPTPGDPGAGRVDQPAARPGRVDQPAATRPGPTGQPGAARRGGPPGAGRPGPDGQQPPGAPPTGAASPGGADDWPEPARPGGGGSSPVEAGASGGDGWPEPARPGGVPASTVPDRTVASAARPVATATGGQVRAPGAGLAAARAAAAGRGGGTATTVADREWAGEPPYDPEYDGPPPSATAGYEGFDPGDEPLDDVIDERTARQSSEQQAVRLLQEAFRAERIGEVDL